MSWEYSGDPSSSAKDATRFLIGDTNRHEPLLDDEEINYLLGQYNQSPVSAGIRCCETIAVKFARLVDESVGQVKLQYNQRQKTYLTMADMLRARMAREGAVPYASGIFRSDKRINARNAALVKPDFSKHMMENEQTSPWVYWGWIAWGNDGPPP